MRDVYIVRQPIYDRRLDVCGYELFLHPTGVRANGSVEHKRAAAQLVLDTLVDVGLDTLVGDALAFLNVPNELVLLLLKDIVPALPAPQLVVQLDEHLAADEAVVEIAGHLVSEGCLVALRGFAGQPALLPLVDLADVVRIDARQHDPVAVGEILATLRRAGVRVLADHVGDYPAFSCFRDLGVDYFQGTFLYQPDIVAGKRSGAGRAPLLLLTRLQDPDADFAELEALVSQDVGLTYKLLRLVNSAWYGRRVRIESVRQALLLLGTRTVSAWLSLIVMAGIPGKPHELMTTAVVRARMCELLAGAMGRSGRESYFLTGLLSVLDALLDMPMAEVVRMLPLAEHVARALVSREGELGEVLASVLAFEQAEWTRVARVGLRPSLVTDAFLDAIGFAREVRVALGA